MNCTSAPAVKDSVSSHQVAFVAAPRLDLVWRNRPLQLSHELRVQADLDLPPFEIRRRLSSRSLRESHFDQPVCDAIDRRVHAAPFLGERHRHADGAGLPGRVVDLSGIAEQASIASPTRVDMGV